MKFFLSKREPLSLSLLYSPIFLFLLLLCFFFLSLPNFVLFCLIFSPLHSLLLFTSVFFTDFLFFSCAVIYLCFRLWTRVILNKNFNEALTKIVCLLNKVPANLEGYLNSIHFTLQFNFSVGVFVSLLPWSLTLLLSLPELVGLC